MKAKRIWMVLVLAALVFSLTLACAAVRGFVKGGVDAGVAQIPAVDADGDGTVDPQFVAWSQQFGGGIPVLPTVLGLLGTGLAIWAKVQDSRNHAKSVVAQEENKKEIELTDINVAKVAAAAKVPDHELV